MGSRNKNSKLNYYQVKVTDYKIDDCECGETIQTIPPLKHMKRLKEKLDHCQYDI